MRHLAWNTAAFLLLTTSALARSTGPAARLTGAPGDNQLACTQCHTTSPLNSGKGSLRIVFSGGSQYTPGATYRMKVEIRDPDQVRWGFQISARLASAPATAQAGDLRTVDGFTQVICENAAAKPCADDKPIQLLMHNAAGTRNGTPGGVDFEFDWTAPQAGAGSVTFYAAGNAANGNGNNQGDYIYTTSLSVDEAPSRPALAVPPSAYDVRHLVSDLPVWAERVDPNLKTPWGISMGPTTAFWLSNAGTGTSTLYNTAGELFPVGNPLIVRVPAGGGRSGPARVTGQVWNGTQGFALASGQPAAFIFATEGGVIAGWNRNVDATNAVAVVDDPSASYKGLASGLHSSGPALYAANFSAATIDAFDYSFKPLSTAGGFRDPNLPAGYAPFNIQRLGQRLYVAYARQDAAKLNAVDGEGSGIINVFDLDGNLKQRLATGGPLNSPWGMAVAPAFFGDAGGTLLVGNYGDGRINSFDLATGQFLGTLKYKNGNPIALEGLLGLAFGNGRNGGDAFTLYFTAAVSAGGAKGDHGVFGSLTVLP